LKSFVQLIRNFSIPPHLNKFAKKHKLPPFETIKTVPQLVDALGKPDWRINPMQFDLPAPSQLFAQLVVEAGIEGIVYLSKYNGKLCLAAFPQNFNWTVIAQKE
jgi:hypothetical protein